MKAGQFEEWWNDFSEQLTRYEASLVDAEMLNIPGITHKGQRDVAALRVVIGDKWPHPDAMDSWAFLVTEVGEVGDALLRYGYGTKQNYSRNNEREADLVKELGDVYMMLCTLATCLEIDLGEALQERVVYLKEKHG